jgi:hypothetical protein
MPEVKVRRQPKDGQVLACLMAGIGGALPTLCNMAAVCNSQGVRVIDWYGAICGIGLYSLIGLCLCAGFGEKRRREAFVLGIAAPAVIASFLNGATVVTTPKNQMAAVAKNEISYLSLFNNAYAEGPAHSEVQPQSTFWISFRRSLGFNVDAENLQVQNIELQDHSIKVSTELRAVREEFDSLKKDCANRPSTLVPTSSKSTQIVDSPSATNTCPASDPCPKCPTAGELEACSESTNQSDITRYMGLSGLANLSLKHPHSERLNFHLRVFQWPSPQVKRFLLESGFPEEMPDYSNVSFAIQMASCSCEWFSLLFDNEDIDSFNDVILYEMALAFPEECHWINPRFVRKFEETFVDRFITERNLGF